MSLTTLFLLFGSLYLVIIAYGVVRTRKRSLPPRLRLISAAIQVIVPPVVGFALLLAGGDAFMIGGWGSLLAMLAVAGALLALCTDIVARRVL